MFALHLARAPDREAEIIKMVAFIGRYGRQPRSEIINLPFSEVMALQKAIAELMREEKVSMED